MANDIKGWMGPKFPQHMSYSWERSPGKLQSGILNWTGKDPGPLGDRQRCYPLVHSDVRKVLLCYTVLLSVESPKLKTILWEILFNFWFLWSRGNIVTLLILQAYRRFTYVTAHSPTLPSLYLRHSSFSNPSVASPTSQLILQPFLLLCHRLFTYDTWRTAHAHAAGPGSIPGRVNFLVEDFLGVFSQP